MYKIIGADKKEYGPVTADQIRQWIAEGRANGQTMVQAEGTAEWKPLASFPEFTPALGAQPAVSAGLPPFSATPAGISPAARANVPNYLVFAILATICCCPATGIPAIVYAAQVNTKLDAGDVAGATRASNNARMWCWISLAVGLVVTVINIIVMVATGGFHAPQGF